MLAECKGVAHMRWWVDNCTNCALEGHAGSLAESEKHASTSRASANGLARLFVPLLMDKSLASDSQLLPSFFRESGRTMTCACVPQLEAAH